jgi:hypothetical protein
MAKFNCIICGSEFMSYNKGAKYCSKPCQGKGMRKLPDKECEYCKKIFRPRDSQQRFCSVKCRPSNRVIRVKTNCLHCGKEMLVIPSRFNDPVRGKYCSKECLATRYGETNCKHCGKKLVLYLSDIKENNFCNQECKNEWMSYTFNGENASAWRGGCYNYRGDNWKAQRRKALKRDGNKCVKCGATSKEAKLMVHHKIPFRFFNGDYEKANVLENLETNCNSCHSAQESHLWHEVPVEFKRFL